MALYRYIKAPPSGSKRRNRSVRGTSFLLMGLGSILLAWVAWPIVSFSIITSDLFAQTVTPIQDIAVSAAVKSVGSLSPVVFASDTKETTDYSNANIWFPTAPQKKVVAQVNTYLLSIPKLKIHDATVIIGGDDLNTSLIHYGGTATPGEYGNTVIFGHSTLTQFYNPKSYKSIFSLLPTLKIGDQITITYDGVSYVYDVTEMTVSSPADLSSLEQRFDDSYLTLITCVPPGTYWQRLHVKAVLHKLP